MKAAMVALVTLLAVSGDHVTIAAAGARLSVPVPVLALALVLAACAVLTRLIWQAARPRCYPCLQRRTT